MNFRKVNFRSPTGVAAIGVGAAIILALVVVIALLRTGGGKAVSDNAALIGALVALGGVFTAQMVSIALDDRRSHEARDLEAQRAGEAALQNYLGTVGELIIEKPLHRASPGDNLSTVVRAQTLAVLQGMDPAHKRILLQFLYESELIHKDKPVVSLVYANLRQADLNSTFLQKVNLGGVNLREAHLRGAHLGEADLSEAHLRGGGVVVPVNLVEADLSRAYLSGAYLSGAYLNWADLSGADLSWADLSRANLSGADLSGANLSGANLSGALIGISNEELEHQALTLEGATMPDGSKHH